MSSASLPTDSTVSVFPAEAPHNIMYHATHSRNFLTVLADTMCTLGNVQMYVMGDTMVVIGPEHAKFLHRDGWNKRDIRQFLYEHARKPVRKIKQGGPPQGDSRRGHFWPRYIDADDDDQMVPVVRAPGSHQHFRRRRRRRPPFGLPPRLGLPAGHPQNPTLRR